MARSSTVSRAASLALFLFVVQPLYSSSRPHRRRLLRGAAPCPCFCFFSPQPGTAHSHLALVVTSTAPGPPPPQPLLASPHYSGRLPKPICLVRFVRFVRFVRSFAPLPDPLAPRHHEPHHAYLHPGEVRQRLLPTQQPPPPAASHASLIVVLLAMMLQPQQPVART